MRRRPLRRPAVVMPRDAAIAATPRIKIESPRISGSISLKGARIDDVALTQYRETVDPKSPAIVLFSPSGTAEPYYAEFLWVPAAGSTGKDSEWRHRLAAGRVQQPDADDARGPEIRQQ